MNPLNSYSQRAKNRTEAAAMNGGLEIALTILLFVLLGFAIDNWLGTKPLFVIVLFLFGAIGSGLRYYYTYTADMERLEAEFAAQRRATRKDPVQHRSEQRSTSASAPAPTAPKQDGNGLSEHPSAAVVGSTNNGTTRVGAAASLDRVGRHQVAGVQGTSS